LGIASGVGAGDELTEAVRTEIFGDPRGLVQTFGFETKSTARAEAA
jgi:hypothetical protein